MKKLAIIVAMMLVSLGLYSQNRKAAKASRYETVIYTSDKINVLIRNEYKKQAERRQDMQITVGIPAGRNVSRRNYNGV
jgi:hypothetical protein